jgi:hypothetical protein
MNRKSRRAKINKGATGAGKWFALLVLLILLGLLLGSSAVFAQGTPLPTPDLFSPEVEQARARQAMEVVLAKSQAYWGPRYNLSLGEVTVEAGWGYGVAEDQNQPMALNGPIHILAHRLQDGTWQALLPDGEGAYLQWLDAIPERLLTADEKTQLRVQGAQANALRWQLPTPMIAPDSNTIPMANPSPASPLKPISTTVQQVGNRGSSLIQGWQTYSDAELNFSILYPNGWFVHKTERSPADGVLVGFAPESAYNPGEVIPLLWIEVVPKQPTLGLDEWTETYVLQDLPTQIRSSVHPYLLNGRQGFEITGLPGVLPNLQYLFEAPDRIYRITISPYDPENHEFDVVLPEAQQLRDVMLPSLNISD